MVLIVMNDIDPFVIRSLMCKCGYEKTIDIISFNVGDEHHKSVWLIRGKNDKKISFKYVKEIKTPYIYDLI